MTLVPFTAAHVLQGADEIVVSDAERTTPGTIVGFDPQMDLALVRLAPSARQAFLSLTWYFASRYST